jgi:hypothetical protein
VNIPDQLMRAMVRGFGWGVGRRASSRLPLPLGIALIVVLWYFGGHHG